jgi:hypothetical protein
MALLQNTQGGLGPQPKPPDLEQEEAEDATFLCSLCRLLFKEMRSARIWTICSAIRPFGERGPELVDQFAGFWAICQRREAQEREPQTRARIARSNA